jgi:hypothetical protein
MGRWLAGPRWSAGPRQAPGLPLASDPCDRSLEAEPPSARSAGLDRPDAIARMQGPGLAGPFTDGMACTARERFDRSGSI